MRNRSISLAVICCLAWFSPACSRSGSASADPAWTVRKTGTGLAISWNLDRGQFSRAGAVTLAVNDGGSLFEQKLPAETGTIYYTPRTPTPRVYVDLGEPGRDGGRRKLIYGEERVAAVSQQQVRARAVDPPPTPPSVIAAHKPFSTLTDREERPMSIEVSVSEKGQPVLRTRTPVWVKRKPDLPASLARLIGRKPVEIEVFIKINENGQVAAASTRFYDDALRRQLANSATRAALHWRFAPVRVGKRPAWADAQLSFRFPTA